MMAEFGSRSDLEALRRSGRGKIVAVVLLMLVAMGLALWSFLREEGIGDAEDPTKVIVVSRGTTVGYSAFLKDLGFDAAEGTLAAWQAKAEAEVEELDATGVDAVLTLADKFGYGYVVFEAPQEVDFGGLDIEGGVPEFGSDVRFAVLSVGDFGFPHQMTVNPMPSAVVRDPGMSMLQALFEQEGLDEALPDNDNPEISTIQLRDKLRDALDHLARIPAAEEMADKVLAQVRSSLTEEERAEPRPEALTEALESATPIPLPSGAVLTMGRRFSIVTRDAVRADLALDDAERFYYGDVGAAPEARKVCTSLAGGEMSVDDSARYAFSADGSAILIKNLSEGMLLWVAGLDRGSETPGTCAFERVGSVPAPAPGVATLGVPHRSGAVARAGVVDGRGVIEVVTVRDGSSVVLGMLHEVEFSEPVWIDESTLVAIGKQAIGSESLYVFHTGHSALALHLDASLFEGATELAQVAAVGGAHKGRLVVTAGSFPRKLYRLDAPADWAGLFDAPPRAEVTPEVELEPEPGDVEGIDGSDAAEVAPVDQGPVELVELDPNRFVALALTNAGQAFDPVVSPDGKWVAMGLRDRDLDRPDASDDDEIALASLAEASKTAPWTKLRLLTRNALRDHSPRFSGDGTWVVFQTRIEIPRTDWTVTAARRALVNP